MEVRGKSEATDAGDGPSAFDAAVQRLTFLTHRRKAYGWTLDQAGHSAWDVLAFAVSGHAHYTCGDRSWRAGRGTLMWFPPGSPRTARADTASPWSFYAVGFHLEPLGPAAEARRDALPRQVTLANATEVRGLLQQLERLWVAREPGWAMGCSGLVGLLLQQFVSASARQARKTPHAEAIDRCVERMHDQVGHVEPIRLLAQRAGLSESRFRALFREVTGCSATRYQNRLRIRLARDLLASGQYSVSGVARELEFNDVYYFSRLFKRLTGTPPSDHLPPPPA
ncbi:MAG: AraC family transcriptional regulator [Planctomycetota bacterium]